MGLRQRIWAAKSAEKLKSELGHACAKCGRGETKRNKLEFDCKQPQGDKHHKMEWSARISFYWAQHRAGNLQLLCKKPCHVEKSKSECGGGFWNAVGKPK